VILIDGKHTAQQIKVEIKAAVEAMLASGRRAPHLVAVLVGEDGASQTYVGNKIKTCAEVGFRSTLKKFDDSISEAELLNEIHRLNNDEEVDGFIVQLPLPKHIDVDRITEAIQPSKDVDGFHPVNLGRMVQELPSYTPATPKGIIQLLERYKLPTYARFNLKKAFEILRKDKKKMDAAMQYVFIHKIGKGVVKPVPLEELSQSLEPLMA